MNRRTFLMSASSAALLAAAGGLAGCSKHAASIFVKDVPPFDAAYPSDTGNLESVGIRL